MEDRSAGQNKFSLNNLRVFWPNLERVMGIELHRTHPFSKPFNHLLLPQPQTGDTHRDTKTGCNRTASRLGAATALRYVRCVELWVTGSPPGS